MHQMPPCQSLVVALHAGLKTGTVLFLEDAISWQPEYIGERVRENPGEHKATKAQ